MDLNEMINDYRFQYLSTKKIESLENKEVKENLLKWSMKDRISIQAFSFDKPFHKYQQQSFFQKFFADPHVISNLQVLTSTGRWTSFGLVPKSVILKEVPCSVTSMEIFDRLFGSEVVRESGSIVRCEEEFCEELDDYVDDELKKMLLRGGDLYSDEERKEFLLLLLTHLLIGGSLCQPDFQIHNYLKVAKMLYRDLIGVHRDCTNNKILVSSLVFKVNLLDASGHQIYPCSEEHFQNVAYACVDPLKKQICILNHRFGVTLPTIE